MRRSSTAGGIGGGRVGGMFTLADAMIYPCRLTGARMRCVVHCVVHCVRLCALCIVCWLVLCAVRVQCLHCPSNTLQQVVHILAKYFLHATKEGEETASGVEQWRQRRAGKETKGGNRRSFTCRTPYPGTHSTRKAGRTAAARTPGKWTSCLGALWGELIV